MTKFVNAFNSKPSILIRLILFIGCTFVCPIIFISMKFQLIQKTDGNTIKFTGWGIIALLIVVIALFFLLKWVVNNFGYSYWLGVLNGFISLILWLILALVLCKMIHNYIERVEFILGWSIVTCSVGVLLNPLPYLAHKHRLRKIKEGLGADA